MATAERNIALALFGAAFAVAFGLVSAFGLYMLYGEANSALRPLTWYLGSAQVVDAKLHETSSAKGSSTYSVIAQYRYEHAGKPYFGSTIRLGDFGSDDDKAHHEGWVNLLQEAKAIERGLPVYINPDAPNESALSTKVRWRNVFFALPFVFLFGAVAIGGCLAALSALGVNLKRSKKSKALS